MNEKNIYYLEDLKSLFEIIPDCNFIAFAITPLHVQGIKVGIQHLTDLKKKSKDMSFYWNIP